MPCTDYGREDESARENRKYLDKLTRLLCEACQDLNDLTEAGMSTELLEWWTQHKKRDAERIATEKKAQEEKDARSKALSKLTFKERRLLGL